jgi:D-alanyl-D-alanine carboxypeptidase (penicillin-binding protein 5/6)
MIRKRSLRFSILPFLVFLFFFQTAGTGTPLAIAKRTPPPAGQGKAASSEAASGQINAKAAFLAEVSTGTLLLEQSPDEIIEPASFTKVLTLYLVFEALKQGVIHLTDEAWVSETAWRTGGSKMFVSVGSKVPLEELIKGIAVVSGNDACVAVAEHLQGSTEGFVDAMNRKAAELGMKNSHFLNPHGLPAEGQVTTARDMATLAVAYLQRFPEALRFHSMQEFTYNNITQHNRNRLLFKDAAVDGLKTGFVSAAGYHLTATSQREGMRLVAVVMGAATPGIREREAMRLLNYGFRHYTMVQPFPAGQPLATIKVWKGVKDSLSLFPAEAATFLIPQAQKNSLRWEVSAPTEVTAPVEATQPLGEVIFYVGGEPKKTVALNGREDVAQAGLAKRAWQTVVRVDKINWRWVGGITGGIVLVLALFFFVARRRSSSRKFKSFS